MPRTIKSALISVYYKEGLEPIVRKLHQLGVTLYSTGGTQKFIEDLEVPCHSVESLTGFPSILGGRVKTLHPKVFGGILARRAMKEDVQHLLGYDIPQIDLVIVDLYPFAETVAATQDEAEIIEKIDIGGVSLIRAAAKNYNDVCVIAAKEQYPKLLTLLHEEQGVSNPQLRKQFAKEAFAVCAEYDNAIAQYFDNNYKPNEAATSVVKHLRYGENPHQQAMYKGDLNAWFDQLHGKELSYNNLVDVDAACSLIAEFEQPTFAISKHTNVCGIAQRATMLQAWKDALAGDPESAFGGVLVCNAKVDAETAAAVHELFFEILIAPDFEPKALDILQGKKNRILLKQKKSLTSQYEYKRILDGTLQQQSDNVSHKEWKDAGARPATEQETKDLRFANIVSKHLKSNAIALVKNEHLIGKGCGQTSRIDALRQAIEKAKHFGYSLEGAVMASDAFFPFDDCIRMAREQGIMAVIQPGGSVRDQDTIDFAKAHDMALIITGTRHFKH